MSLSKKSLSQIRAGCVTTFDGFKGLAEFLNPGLRVFLPWRKTWVWRNLTRRPAAGRKFQTEFDCLLT